MPPPGLVELSIDLGEPIQVRGPIEGALTGVVMRALSPAPAAALPPMVEAKTPPGIAKPLDDISGFQVTVPGNAVLFGFFIAIVVAISFANERHTGTWRRLLAAPVPRWQPLVGKLVPYFLISVVQLGFLFGIGVGLFGMKIAGDVSALVALTLAVSLCAVSFGLLVSSFGGTERQIGSTVPVIVLVMGLLGGCMFPRILMPHSMQQLGHAVPQSLGTRRLLRRARSSGHVDRGHRTITRCAMRVRGRLRCVRTVAISVRALIRRNYLVVRWRRMTQVPPGALGAPFLGETLAFLKNPFEFTLSRTRQHGNIWKTRILGDTVVFFAGAEAFSFFMNTDNFTRQNGSPKFLQELLHPDAVPFLDGDRFKTRKRLLLAAFTDAALESYLPGITKILTRYVDGWSKAGELAIVPDLNQLAFDIADMLFAAADPNTSNRESAADFTLMNKGAFSPPVNLPFTAYGKAVRARDRLRAYIKRSVAEKDGAGSALGVLKAARGPNGEQLSSAELEIELLHFYFAAHSGIAAAIAWLVVVLGEHPELAARLRVEADAQLGDAVPSLATIGKLEQARAVSREVLRAYPIAPTTFIGVAKKDLELDGYGIRAGWKGAGAIWATLQDGTTFQDPTAISVPIVSAMPRCAHCPRTHSCRKAAAAARAIVAPAKRSSKP